MSRDWAGIVDSYADLLGRLPSTGHAIRDASVLPYPRATIREAISQLLKVERDPRLRDAIKGAYVALATFQELTPEERHAIDVLSDAGSGDSSLEETKARAQRMLAVLPIHSAVMERFQADRKTFTEDMAKVP
jgi:hypothetical protein